MNDERLETTIGNLLLAGVLLAVTVVAGGGLLYLIRHYADIANYSTFQGNLSELRTFGEIWRGTLRLQSDALIQMGLLILIATPVARVALAAIGFFMERDHLYVTVSLTVLAILAYSILHVV